MSTRSHAIELNGRHYDTRTGKLIDEPTKVTVHKPTTSKSHTGVSVDGIAKRPKAARQHVNSPKVHQKTERSKTLMRHAVKKPASQTESAHSIIVKKRTHTTKPSASHKSMSTQPHNVDVAKSKLISKFGSAAPTTPPRMDTVPLRPEPTPPPALVHHTLFDDSSVNTHLAHALARADSHKQPHHKKQRLHHKTARRLHMTPRVMGIATSALSVLLLVGFIAYQNVPNLNMQLASSRAGVAGSLPAYRPSGFALQKSIHHEPGKVTLSYQSNTDTTRAFAISQENSEWNSETLLENYINADNRAYQTHQSSGKTIYLYDNNATWVDGGIWYRVEGNAALSSDQLVRLASSL